MVGRSKCRRVNLLLSKKNNKKITKIIDFGCAENDTYAPTHTPHTQKYSRSNDTLKT